MKKKKKKKDKASGSSSGRGGLIGFDEAPKDKKQGYKEPWYKTAPLLEQPPSGKEKCIRPVEGFYETYQHWIKFKDKDGKMRMFPMICPDYDRETRKFKQGSKKKCPVCIHFMGSHLPDHLNFFGSFKYYFDAFDLDAIEADSGGRTFGICQCGKYGRKDIVKASRRNGVAVDDFEKGCTLYWEKNPKEEDPKDREGFSRGKRKKVTWNEKKKCYFLTITDEDGEKRKVKGKPTDFESVIVGPTPEEIRDDLERLGLWDALEKESNVEGKKKKKKKSRDEDDDGSKKKKKKNRNKKQRRE